MMFVKKKKELKQIADGIIQIDTTLDRCFGYRIIDLMKC